MAGKTPLDRKPHLSKRAFWDTDLAALDFSRHGRFIITRVFERGSAQDILAITNYYDTQTIVRNLTAATSLLPVARERAKKHFHLSDQDFVCYKSKQPTRNLSAY